MKSAYQKIASQSMFRIRFTGAESLWYSEENLLWVIRSGLFVPFSEKYRRIAYQDIQGVTIHRPTYSWWPMILLLGIGLLIIGASSLLWSFSLIQDPWISFWMATPSLLF